MTDPITREQVERAIAKPRCIDYRELPRGWREWAPDYVIAAEADDDWDADDWDAEHAALTRWRDELVAAETPRAAEAERADKPDPGVVDVPQPEPWHARLVRLASDVAAATKAHEDAQAEREAAERRESDAWTALRNARGALHDATKVSAILAAQSEPTRPEPRYKAGDWVRVMSVADGGDASCVGVVFRVLSVFVSNGIDIYVSPKHGTWPVEHLTPALDPALHETARRTVAWLLRNGARGEPPSRYYNLPGHGAYVADMREDDAERWAAQLERLLGDAP